MSAGGQPLQEKFSQCVRWERTKRREKLLVSALFYSTLASVIAFPVQGYLPAWIHPLSLPLCFFLLLVPALFLLYPWGEKESLRAIFLLDKTLRLQERALTAWEVLGRKEKKAVELLVLEEAGAKLQMVDPRALFKRPLSWQALFTPPLLLLWFLIVWLDVGVHFERGLHGSGNAVAQRLMEFVHELKERAQSEELSESLKMAHALERVAEKGLQGEMSEKKLRQDLAAMVEKIEDRHPGAKEGPALPLAAASRKGLLDLKAELEALRAEFPPGPGGMTDRLDRGLVERLAALPRLKEEIERGRMVTDSGEKRELQKFLAQLEKEVAAELDRRTLSEIKEFLSLLIQGLKGGDTQAQDGKELGEPLAEASRADSDRFMPEEKGKGTLPGDRPGLRERSSQASSPFSAAAATHLKGLLREGQGLSLPFRGESSGRESEVKTEEVITSYRHQAEEELNSEEIPKRLRETIKHYFLSLGVTQGEKEE